MLLAALLLAKTQAQTLTPTARPKDPAIIQIIDEGKNHSHVMDFLRYIAIDIGGRSTGSPELAKGEKWAYAQFKKMGCDVRLEHWEDVPGFQRGPIQSARMVAPFQATFQFSTNVWTQGTNGPVKGQAVTDPTTLDQAKAMAGQLKGAWVLMPYKSSMGGARNRDDKDLKDYVDSCGIAGRVYPSSNDLVHTHGTYKW